jgi:hypothetical protein
MIRRSTIRFGVAIAAIPLLAACGDTAEMDLCTQYADLVTAAEQLQQQDPMTATAEDLRAASREIEAELDQFQAVSEGRLDTAISTLRANVDAVRQAAIEEGGEALETARQLLEDVMDDVAQAWAVVQKLADAQCDVG